MKPRAPYCAFTKSDHATTYKRASQSSRARKEARKAVTAKLAKIIKKAASIGELLTKDDQEENLRVIREAKQACHVYLTKNGQIEVPDHKTRLAAVALDLAYREGKPIDRKEVLTANLEDFPTRLRRLQESERFKQLQNSEYSILKGELINVEVGSASNPAVGSSGE